MNLTMPSELDFALASPVFAPNLIKMGGLCMPGKLPLPPQRYAEGALVQKPSRAQTGPSSSVPLGSGLKV